MSTYLRQTGLPRQEIDAALRDFTDQDRAASAGIRFSRRFFPNAEVAAVAAYAYGLFAHTGRASPYPGLASPPSMVEMQRDIVATAVDLLGGGADTRAVITSGGTESVILAAKSCLNHRRALGHAPETPEIVASWPAHPCIDKAAELLGLRLIRVPVGADFCADIRRMADAISLQTIMIYGSFPSYCYGVEDDIAALGALAEDRDLWLHVDACMSGFLAPFARMNGEPIPDFDFRVPGVSSISADLHKHGYSAKGASMLLFKSEELARHHSFTYDDYPLPPMMTPTLAGTAPGAPIASAWAVMRYLGVAGYCDLAQQLSEARHAFIAAVQSVPGFYVLGHPLFSLVTFSSDIHDMRAVQAALAVRGWFTLPLINPFAIHLNLSATDASLAVVFAADLAEIIKGIP